MSSSCRACYHFDLMENLTNGEKLRQDIKDRKSFDAAGEEANDGNNTKPRSNSNINSTIHNEKIKKKKKINSKFCGVAAILECIPFPNRSGIETSRKKLNENIKIFNKIASSKRHRDKSKYGKGRYCHEPAKMPLELSFGSRNTGFSFVYELTRIVFCLDASSTLTSTNGNMAFMQSNDGCICAMDRLEKMVRMYFKGEGT